MEKFLPLLSTRAKQLGAVLLFVLGLASFASLAQGITPGHSGNYITTWKTDNPGGSGSTQLILPIHPDETYNFDLYWEEVGSASNHGTLAGITGPRTLTFPHAGTYRVEIAGAFPRNHFAATGGDNRKLVAINRWGAIQWNTMENAFMNAANVVYQATDAPNLSNVTDLSGMFRNAGLFNGDLSNWDVSNVTRMWAMFEMAESFNGNIRNWDVSNVTDMGSMFLGAGAFNQDIGDWNVSGVQSMIYMFNGASSFNADLSAWNVSSVLDMRHLFFEATGFNQSLGNWKISTGTNMESMLDDSGISRENYDATLIGWAAQPNVPVGITLGAKGMLYCEGATARQSLISNHSWTINGDVARCPVEITPGANNILYVDVNVNTSASGYTGVGDSWANAIPELRDALTWAAASWNGGVQGRLQIWVANGTYLPGADRTASFRLKNYVELYGGFSGDPSETQLSQRNFKANPTILSGDIDRDGTKAGNAYHVVNGAGVNATAKLDGFTVTGGNADGTGDNSRGGGMHFYNGGPTLLNIMVLNNYATADGGGIFMTGSWGTVIRNSLFTGNEAGQGGGLFGQNSSIKIANSTFSRNRSAGRGGGIAYGWNGFLTMSNTLIWDNEAEGSTTSWTASFFNASGSNTLSNNLIANSGGADPLFRDPANGDYSLQPGSPAMDAGSNDKYTAAGGDLEGDTDLGNNPRVSGFAGGGVIDIGAYEIKGEAVLTPDGQNILYVDINVNTAAQGYTGSGDSWANAVPQLADALKWARTQHTEGTPGWDGTNPLKIYVAKGTYLPAYGAAASDYSSDAGRFNTFVLVPDVKLYGGFDPGNGIVALDDTRILPDAENPGEGTVLSGDLGMNDHAVNFEGHAENAKHVLLAIGELGSGSIDGFTITGGSADGVEEADPYNEQSIFPAGGGGMLILTSSPSLTDCLFFRNYGEGGAGVSSAASNSLLIRCVFLGNSAKFGAGMTNGEGSATVLTECVFSGNVASAHGGAMYNYLGGPTVIRGRFYGNSAPYGGGIRNLQGAPILEDCEFLENKADYGGGIANSATLSLTGGIFLRNSAETDGGAIFNTGGSTSSVTGTIFMENTGERGGAIRNNSSVVEMRNAKLSKNSATQGGAISSENCPSISLVGCVLSENTAMVGAAMSNGLSQSVTMINCTVTGNKAATIAGALANVQTPATLSNLIIWGNELNGSVSDPAASLLTIGDLPVISRSLIANWGGSAAWDGSRGVDDGGNIDTDPLFVDPANGGYSLQICSPAINKGDNAKLPAGFVEDAAGSPRTVHALVDMGALEYQDELPVGRLALNSDESTKTVNGATDFLGNDEACRLIASVAPHGTNPVSGSVTARVTIDPQVAYHNGSPYVQRHYVINAQTSGSARITLYFTQEEFDNFSAQLPDGPLPANPTDGAKKRNLRIFQYEGAAGIKPGDYNGEPVTIVPHEDDINWDAVNERWEVSFNVTGFSGFFAGSVASPLPVRLVSFTGSLKEEKSVLLNWKVVEQHGIAAYEIEYSANGSGFSKIGTVKATDTEEASYRFSHAAAASPKGVAYYRLRILELDGTRGYSPVIRVGVSANAMVRVYPMPADNGFWVESAGIRGTTANLVNVHGTVVKTWTFSSDKQYVDTGALSTGVYFVRLADGTSLKVVRK
ncbi:hypothetical protein GCM10023091_20410 [Ravibacter arvi]|uniref:Secretion system C-terminal sorting domain-containing protein n=1 Tax=Ravibacter arvi TaxID=2051041 RepID=A0ABP8LZF2_9BACT